MISLLVQRTIAAVLVAIDRSHHEHKNPLPCILILPNGIRKELR